MSQENKIEAKKPSQTTDFLPSDGASCSVIFVGGHADGKRADLLKLHPAIKSVVEKPRTPETNGAFQSYEIGEEIHTLRRWRSNDTNHALYVLDSMSDADAMGRLLDHYRPNLLMDSTSEEYCADMREKLQKVKT